MIDKKILIDLIEFLESNLNKASAPICEAPLHYEKDICEKLENIALIDFITTNRKPTFNQLLFNFIDEQGVSDSYIYKRAGIDRRHFSKIRSNPNYKIGKNTAIALSLALELNKEDADDLLSAAGYSLSDSDTFDLVIQFCLDRKIYDIQDINQALNYFSLKPLIGVLE